GAKMPKVFHVNWFKKGTQGEYLWPGFGDNMRVLEWVLGRVDGNAAAVESPLGYQPTVDALNTAGLAINSEQLQELLAVDKADWVEELQSQAEFLGSIGEKLPSEMLAQYEDLKKRLG
ncbi:MAG: phosphoenolpyruvate carboxykinase (GTP), partial [Bdellovibrionales bacterium]|nr:phosphoenolpyruvate carboxykinase (GTP) [Bdellovibrionales bacterium]